MTHEEAVNDLNAIKEFFEQESGAYPVSLEYAIKVLKNELSADRPQGKWKAKSFHEYFCHNCGFSFDVMKCEFLENMKYCPNCGVRKGADNE